MTALAKLDPEGRGRFAFLAYHQGLEHGPEDFRPNPPSVSGEISKQITRIVFSQPR